MIPTTKKFFLEWQNRVCDFLEREDGEKKFSTDEWQHQEEGGGISKVMQQGKIFEKAGVNFSHVRGKCLPAAATAKRPELKGAGFEALGVSIVVHPHNPFVPTTHANLRFIFTQKNTGETVWWFGGGFDLTPYYGFTDDCVHWHRTAKDACDAFGESVYPAYKKNCDDYFYLKHRNEPRGIGGLFFDDLNEWGFDQAFLFIKNIGAAFIAAYQPIVAKRKSCDFSDQHKQFQLYRRGRYVEFNLLYDRGTLFGLQSGGRTESVLMSLPPLVSWQYDWNPEAGSEEEKLYREFLIAKEWV